MGTNSRWYAMTDLIPYNSDNFDLMDRVAQLTMQGKQPTTIAKELDLKRTEVLNYQQQWRELLADDKQAHEQARDQLNQMVKHYDHLIAKSYELLEDLATLSFSHQVSSQINNTLKNISDYEKFRVDALQKAGMLEGADLGDELADMEHKQSILIDILRNNLCEVCQPVVAARLREVTGQVESIRVE
jgi:hypothetical protein